MSIINCYQPHGRGGVHFATLKKHMTATKRGLTLMCFPQVLWELFYFHFHLVHPLQIQMGDWSLEVTLKKWLEHH